MPPECRCVWNGISWTCNAACPLGQRCADLAPGGLIGEEAQAPCVDDFEPSPGDPHPAARTSHRTPAKRRK